VVGHLDVLVPVNFDDVAALLQVGKRHKTMYRAGTQAQREGRARMMFGQCLSNTTCTVGEERAGE
jgi:hypothetical protein